MRIPDPPRSWVVRRTPTRFVGEVMRAGSTRDPARFECIYTKSNDPYGFDRNDYEQLKFARRLEVCGDGPFARALELGCAVGSFTEMLAPRCRELLAVDISAAAVKRATERLSSFAGVTCEVRNLPSDLPPGSFDLIVASDIPYYWTKADVEAAVQRFSAALRPGGALVAAHYVRPWGVLLTGDEAHDLVRDGTTLRHVVERTEFGPMRRYRVDRYDSAPNISVRQRAAPNRWALGRGTRAASLPDARRCGTARPGAHPGPERRPSIAGALQRELLEHRLHRDDVALEAELRVLEAGGDADQLREVEDRHLEVLAGLLLELRLPRVE